MTITKIMHIPDIDRGAYRDDIKALPYWMFGHYHDGESFVSTDNVSQYPGAIWVGFVELDPFLGAAKRAIQDAEAAHGKV